MENIKVTAIQEAKYLIKLHLEKLINALMTHEITMTRGGRQKDDEYSSQSPHY